MRILKKAIGFVLLMCAVNGLAFASRNTTEEMLQRAGVRGGLIVHLGCGDGVFTAQLYKGSNFLIHGLDLDPRNVKAARQRIQSMGLEGKVTADLYEDKVLPLIDNVVNLIIDDGTEARVSQAEMMRVLSPGGVALLKQKSSGATVTIAGEKWTILKKPVPPEIDEWTHYLHGPDNNAVSQDKVVGSPYHIQWAGNPVWTRSHNEMASYSAIVSAGGRLFYILDEGPIQSIDLPPKWQMVARDAHNGIVLWKRDITAWEGHLRTFKSGPVELPRRLVASGDRVYVTLGYGGPLCILDAATGEDVKIVAGTEGAHEIIHSDGVLYLVSGKMDPAEYEQSMRTMSESPAIRNKSIIAVSETTGKLLWTKSDEDTHELLGTTMCADRGRLYFQGLDQLIALDKKTGNVSWRAKRPVELVRKTWAVPTVVVYNNVVFCAEGILKSSKQKASKGASGPLPTVSDSNQFSWTVTGDTSSQQVGECIAFDAENGKELWRCPAAYGYDSPPNVLVLGGLVWVSQVPLGRQTDMTEGRDPRTGEVKKVIDTAKAYDAPHHHRCYRDKATDDYMLLSRHGVEYVNVTTQEIQRHNWLRGTCQYGVMPANGLLYLPGDSCACYLQSRIPGLWALAPKRNTDITNASTGKKLTQGPAWGDIPAAPTTEPSDWPMHRHDNSRSGSTPVEVSANPVKLWQANLTGELTAPVIAGGKVIVAQKEKHIVTALDAAAGRQLWSFTAGGRIDSPPTISAGMVAFGSHDGYVYCLRISDGQMIWRFRAAPDDKRTVAFGQLESVWPVVGSVSVVGNTLYCVAGRSSYLDGGMALYRLDLATGSEIGKTPLYSRDPVTGAQPEELIEDAEMPGALPDILTIEGESMFLRDNHFDLSGNQRKGDYKPHLYSSAGLLNADWWARTYWIYGERSFGRASAWNLASKYRPSGKLLAVDGPLVYGYDFRGTHKLFCMDRDVKKVNEPLREQPDREQNRHSGIAKYLTPDKVLTHWTTGLDFAVRAMVKTGDSIIAAGPSGEMIFNDPTHPATLAVFKAEGGKLLSQTAISSQPVFDGMAVACRKIYFSTIDGQLVCMGQK